MKTRCLISAAAAASLLLASCGSGVRITKPLADAQKIIDRAHLVETESELRELERLASDYELAYRRSIDGASAERFKALTADALDAAALAVERNREQAEHDAALGAELDAALDAIDRAWRLELTTPDQDGRIVGELAGRVAAIDAGIGELREQYALIDEKLESVDYYDDDADAQLERYAAEQERIENRVAELSREREAVEDEIILYTLAYRLQRGRTFVPSSEMCPAEAAADNCDECPDAQ